MAISDYAALPGIRASGNLASHQYHAVRFGASTAQKTVRVMTNANAQEPIGILQDDPGSGEPATVAVYGICRAELGGTVTFGQTLAVNNDGELIADAELTTGAASDLHHIAYALEGGGDGNIIDVLLHTPNRIGSE